MAELTVPVTDVTKTVRNDVYPAVAPTRPEVSQAGRTVLITGGGTSIGKAIAKAFALANAKTVIIIGRRIDVLTSAVAELQAASKAVGSPTVYRALGADISKSADVDGLWDQFAQEGIAVDVLVQNAAVISETKSLLALGIDAVWHQFEINVKGPLHLAERFQKQDHTGPKFMINISTGAIHMIHNEIVASRPAYPLTKASALFAASLIADSVKPEDLQVISFHPGMIYTEDWGTMGITEDMLPFDKIELAGALAVWAASSEAAFLHGRYFINNWDVTELREGTHQGSPRYQPRSVPHRYRRPKRRQACFLSLIQGS